MRGFILAAVLLSTAATQASARIWTERGTGKTLEGEFIAEQEDRILIRTDRSDKAVAIPIKLLSDEDLTYVRRFTQTDPKAAAAAAKPSAPTQKLSKAEESELKRFDDMVRENPRDAGAYVKRGLARNDHHQQPQAIEDFNKALELDPKNARAYDGRGLAYAEQGDAIKAHEDFDKAIQLDPQLASAYRHRGDNWEALAQTPFGKAMASDAWRKYRDKYDSVYDHNMKRTPWQPLQASKGSSGGPLEAAKLDLAKADQLEQQQGFGRGAGVGAGAGDGGAGGAGSGSGAGAGAGSGSGNGQGDEGQGSEGQGGKGKGKGKGKGGGGGNGHGGGGGNGHGGGGGGNGHGGYHDGYAGARRHINHPTTPVVRTEPPLIVSPGVVAQGDSVMLLANSDAIAEQMPAKKTVAAAGKKQQPAELEPIASVDFYRDKNGNGKYDPGVDELLATDTDASDGWATQVSTANYPPGRQTYFAVPNGAAPEAGSAPGAKPPGGKAVVGKAVVGKAVVGKAVVGKELVGWGDVTAPLPVVAAVDAGLGHLADHDALGAIDLATGTGGVDYVRDHDYPRAIDEYTRLLVDEPDNPTYLRRRVGAYLADGRYDAAVQDYDHLVKVAEPDADLFYNRGCAELAAGRLDAAVADFTASIKLNETRSLAYNNRGTALARQGQFQKASDDFTAAIRLDPSDALAFHNRALAYQKLGDNQRARADADQATALAGDSAPPQAGKPAPQTGKSEPQE